LPEHVEQVVGQGPHLEAGMVGAEEVTGQNGSCVIAEKSGPTLITAWPARCLFRHVLPNRSG
jgi:hypothetical protein